MTENNDSAEAGVVAFENLNRQAQKAGASMAAALASGQMEGRKLDEVLKDVGSRLSAIALRTAGSSLAASLTTTLGQTLGHTLAGSVSGANGQSFGLAMPTVLSELGDGYAGGSPSSKPTLASAQAIRPVSVTLNISTPDAESFRRSEAQVTAALSRAVSRGQRSL